MASEPLDLIVRTEGSQTLLCSPSVGTLTLLPRAGTLLTSGQLAGQLTTLGRPRPLRVPEGVSGQVLGPLPGLTEAPCGYGQVVLRLAPLSGELQAAGPAAAAAEAGSGLFVRAPHAGRFWQRASPGEAPLVSVGDVVEAGRALGLIEVMKTFAQVHYRPTGALPPRARIRRFLVADGAEIDDRAALIEVEPV
jgi:biotin carboxyl carrier protein